MIWFLFSSYFFLCLLGGELQCKSTWGNNGLCPWVNALVQGKHLHSEQIALFRMSLIWLRMEQNAVCIWLDWSNGRCLGLTEDGDIVFNFFHSSCFLLNIGWLMYCCPAYSNLYCGSTTNVKPRIHCVNGLVQQQWVRISFLHCRNIRQLNSLDSWLEHWIQDTLSKTKLLWQSALGKIFYFWRN